MKKLEIISCHSSDWVVVKQDGHLTYEGHHIPDRVWIGILKELGVDCTIVCISDKDMEEGNY